MKMNRKLKKTLSLLLCVLMAFSTVSFAVGASPAVERVSNIEMYDEADGHAHVYGEWVVTKAATCSQQGEKVRYCAVDGCDAHYTRTIAIVENAHTYDSWKTTIEATCETVGSMTAVCTQSGCGHKETRAIKKLEHTIPEMYLADGTLNPEWKISVEPVHGEGFVTQIGYVRASCAICGTTITNEYYGNKDAAGNYIGWHEMSGTVSTIRPATCTTPGVGMDKCVICGDTVSVELKTQADAHVYSGLPIVTTPATCVAEGKGRNQCTECNKVFDVVIEKDPDTHVDASGKALDWVVTKDAFYHMDGVESVNCAEHGTQSRTIYGDHGLTDEDFKVIANPTCVKPGLMIAECDNCNKTIEKEIPVDNAHSWGEAEILCLPTCAQEGIQVRHCGRHYGHVLYETTEKTDHVFSKPWVTEVEADCNNAGRESNECVECTQIVKRVIPIIEDAHDFVDDNGVKHDWTVVTEPTCTSTGTKTNYCYECNKTITKEIPLHANTLIEVSRKEASCTFEGEIFYECKLCAADVYEAIPIDEDAHKYIGEPAVYIAPTCQEPGVGLTVCAYCNKECNTILPVDPEAHVDADRNILEWSVLKAASGCTNGIEKVDCYYCGTKTKTLYSTHGMSDGMFNVSVVASCDKEGLKKSKYKCPDCNSYVYIPIPAAHSGILSKVVIEATCTEDGLALYNCGKGDHLYYEIIPAKGHVAADEYVILSEPTCTTEGEKQLKCKVCNVDIQPPEKIPQSHVYTAWVVEPGKEATCKAPGERYRGCQDCDYYEKTPYGVEHTPGEWTYAKGYDCTTGGTLYKFCTTCNLQLATKQVAAGTHGSTRTETVKATNEYCISTKVVCNVCENTVSETKNSHKSYVIKGMEGWAATCEDFGMTDGVLCMVCGYQTKQEVIPAFGHKWGWDDNGNRVCITCGDYKVAPDEGGTLEPDYDGGCKCFCHDKGMIAKILYKVCVFFWKLLKINQKCDCGTVHWTAEE
ncbi:MAG: hypothetical protein IJW86_03380 [Clostridia bacterium]|nr:hypothetical protein [Clostridia bacterium]